MKENSLLRKICLSLTFVCSISLGLTGCNKPTDTSGSNSTTSANTAAPASSQEHSNLTPVSSRVINASLKSFSCGADACYLTFNTVNNSEITAICADNSFCPAWSMVNTGEEYGMINLAQENGPRVKLSITSEPFEPAGENMDYVRKIEFLNE